MDDKRTYYINVDPGDPYELGYLVDVKFCPYCGRKLGEMEEDDDKKVSGIKS